MKMRAQGTTHLATAWRVAQKRTRIWVPRLTVGHAIPSLLTLLGYTLAGYAADGESPRTHRVSRVKQPLAVEAAWHEATWRAIKPLTLRHFMGSLPDHFPHVQARVAYDDHAIYVMFHVADRYVRAVAQKHQESVCLDSCVEFFFTPSEEASKGYFNLEMNCGGTMLFHYQNGQTNSSASIEQNDLERIEVAHNLPKIIDPEIEGPTDWTVAYRLPFELLKKYVSSDFDQPAPGVKWRANFYKCADKTSHPHWLTWSQVKSQGPNFHRPDQFGILEFE